MFTPALSASVVSSHFDAPFEESTLWVPDPRRFMTRGEPCGDEHRRRSEAVTSLWRTLTHPSAAATIHHYCLRLVVYSTPKTNKCSTGVAKGGPDEQGRARTR